MFTEWFQCLYSWLMVIPQVMNGNFIGNKRPIRRFFCRILWVDAEVVANAIDIRVRPHGRSELLELLELLYVD